MSSKDKDGDTSTCPRRVMLKTVVGALSLEVGFQAIEPTALETLTEALQSYIFELGRSSKAYAEVAGRTLPFVSDILLAGVEMGISIDGLVGYAKRSNKTVLLPPSVKAEPPIHKSLSTGQRVPHSSYVPDNLPNFPDPHTFVYTPTHKQPVSNYQAIREKAAAQKRDVEKALTRFIAKTGNTHNIFHDDGQSISNNLYPLVSCTPSPLPYAAALLSRDHDIDALDLEALAEATPADVVDKNTIDIENIDNPYLRPVKLPKTRKK